MTTRHIQLTNEQWARLEGLAQMTGSVATKGPTAYVGRPSWRALVRRIAEGELVLWGPRDTPQINGEPTE